MSQTTDSILIAKIGTQLWSNLWSNRPMVKLVACRGICDVPFWLLFEFDDLLELASDDDLEAKDEDLILQLGAILIFDFFSEFWRSLDGQNSTNCKEKLKFY